MSWFVRNVEGGERNASSVVRTSTPRPARMPERQSILQPIPGLSPKLPHSRLDAEPDL